MSQSLNLKAQPVEPVVYPDTPCGTDVGIVREAIAAETNVPYGHINPDGQVGQYVKDAATAQAVNERIREGLFGESKRMPGYGDMHFCYDNTLEEQAAQVRENAEPNIDPEDIGIDQEED